MRQVLLVTLTVLGLSGIALAQDPFVIIPDRFSQNPYDLLDWTQLGVDNTAYATPQLLFTFNGNPVLAGNAGGAPFARVDEGLHWTGNFDYGESLVWTGNGTNGIGPGPFVMTWAAPVGSFGFEIQPDQEAPFTAAVFAYDSNNNLLFDNVFSGDGTGQLENGSATFISMGDLAGPKISTILISTTSPTPAFDNDFAIDDVTFGNVPEPGSMSMAAGALLGLTGLLFRKYRR